MAPGDAVVHGQDVAHILLAMNASPDTRDLLAYLDFHVEAGVDAALDETPHDRFAQAEAGHTAAPVRAEPSLPEPSLPEAAPTRPAPAPPPPTRDEVPAQPAPPRTLAHAATGAPGEVAQTARERARSATTLAELEALLADFEGCGLRFTARSLAFSDGNPEARVMFVGEAPGAEEDRIGKPFMGRSGQLLDRMMAAIGLDRTSAYIANVIPWRPPGNRDPTPQEIAICRPFLDRQVELVDPDLIVCLGGPATKTLTGTKDGILKARGRFFPCRTGRREIRALATLHPAYLLRQPLQKRLAWRDFRALKAALAEGA